MTEYIVFVDNVENKWFEPGKGVPFIHSLYTLWENKGLCSWTCRQIARLNLIVVVYFMILVVFAGALDMYQLNSHLSQLICPDGSSNDASLFELDCWQQHPIKLKRLQSMSWIWVVVTSLVGLCWLTATYMLVRKRARLVHAHRFYCQALKLPNVDQCDWPVVVDKIVKCHQDNPTSLPFSTSISVDALFIINCLTRKDNFFVALYTHDVLDLNTRWIPVSESLHWCIEKCISVALLDVNPDGSAVRVLARAYRMVGLTAAVLAPILLAYRMALFIFQNIDDLRSKSKNLLARHWAPSCMFRMRDYCEVPCALKHRLNLSYRPATEYANMFPSPILSTLARFVIVVTGGLSAALLLGSVVYDDSFVKTNFLASRSVAWWLTVLILLSLLCRSCVPSDYAVFQPVEKLLEVANHVHYYPSDWRTDGHNPATHAAFCQLFPYRILLFINEIFAVVWIPYVLLFQLPATVENTVNFVINHAVLLPDVGLVCTMGLFQNPQLIRHIELDKSSLCPSNMQVREKFEASYVNFNHYYAVA